MTCILMSFCELVGGLFLRTEPPSGCQYVCMYVQWYVYMYVCMKAYGSPYMHLVDSDVSTQCVAGIVTCSSMTCGEASKPRERAAKDYESAVVMVYMASKETSHIYKHIDSVTNLIY
jgi:hypothetical protein